MDVSRPIALFLVVAMPVHAESPLVVEIIQATASPDLQSYSLTGEIVARETRVASFPVGGRVAQVFVDVGDQIAAGASLVRIESVQQEQSLRAAEAGLATAQADSLQAIDDLARQDALLARGATTKIGRDAAYDAAEIAEGALEQALANLDRANKALDDTVLRATMHATITSRTVEAGQVVGAAQPVMELALGDGFDAVFDVPEVLMTDHKLLTSIELSMIDAPDTTFDGGIREISPLIDPAKGTVAVKVSVSGAPVTLSFGDVVRGTVIHAAAPRMSLPYTVLTDTGTGPAVWIVDPDTMMVSLSPIEIERFDTGKIVIFGGLEEGTLVVARGAQLLYPGRVVRDMEQNQ